MFLIGANVLTSSSNIKVWDGANLTVAAFSWRSVNPGLFRFSSGSYALILIGL